MGIGGFLLAASPSEGAWRNLLKKGGQAVATPQPAGGIDHDSSDSEVAVAPVAASVGGESSPIATGSASTGMDAPAEVRVSTVPGGMPRESAESDSLASAAAASVGGQESTVAMGGAAAALEPPAREQDSAVPSGLAGKAESAPPTSEVQANSVAESSIEPIVAQSAVAPVREDAPVAGIGAQTVHREEVLAVAVEAPAAPIESRPAEAAVAIPSQVALPAAAANSGRSLEAAAAAEPPKVSEKLTLDRLASRDTPPNPVAAIEIDASAKIEKAPSAGSGTSIQASRVGPPGEASLKRLPPQASDRVQSRAQPQAFEGKVVRVEGAYVTCSVTESSRLHVGMTVGIWNGSKQAARAQILSRRTGFVDLEITEDFGREKASVGSLLRVPH